jgi:hypothetical protein
VIPGRTKKVEVLLEENLSGMEKCSKIKKLPEINQTASSS